MQRAATLWLVSAVWLNCAGWTLAALHQLNSAGWIVALSPGVLLAVVWLTKCRPAISPKKYMRRYVQVAPGIFVLFAILALLGGAIYAPTNYDALTYRLPRILNWLAADTWYWIPTVNERLNCANTAWEWMAMPLLSLTHSDRALFLINWSAFLLMPGLFFSILRQLGVARRVARNWMWILPLAYGYTTQASSIGNDLTGTIFCMLSVFFGLRARVSCRVTDVWLALLAAALMTGIKVSNAPLVLPCLVAIGPALMQLRKQVLATVAVTGIATLISAAPIMALNQIHTGSWTGDPHNQYGMQVKNPIAGLLGNGILVAEQTLMPPFLPGAKRVPDLVNQKIPRSWFDMLNRDYPRFNMASFNELPTEEGAGLGLGVTIVALAGLALSLRGARLSGGLRKNFPKASLVGLAAWAAGLVYMLKVGSEAGPRLLLAYYPLMLAPLLKLSGHERLFRWPIGKFLPMVAALSILPGVILSPARPLWPGETVCQLLARKSPDRPLYQRMLSVYSTYGHRNDVLAPLRAMLPEDAPEIGFIAGPNDTDYSLWRPIGNRRVFYPERDKTRSLESSGRIDWLVVKESTWPTYYQEPLLSWTRTNHYELVFSTNIVELVGWGPEKWSLWRRQP